MVESLADLPQISGLSQGVLWGVMQCIRLCVDKGGKKESYSDTDLCGTDAIDSTTRLDLLWSLQPSG